MMRLGLVIGQIRRVGGMEKQAILLTRELQKRGIRTILFISGPKKSIKGSRALHLDQITWKDLYYSSHFSHLSAWLLRYHCNRNNVSHLMTFNAENAELAIRAKIKAKITINVRGIGFSTDRLLAEKYKNVVPHCEFMITNSENTAGLLHKSGIANEDDIRVIHNGIDLPAVRSSPKGKVVLYVGSIKEVKDPLTFVRACHKIIEIDRDVRIVMAGDGNMRPLVESYIKDNNLTPYFTLLGEVPYENIPYGETSVFVNSSIGESSSNSLLEALSFGIPAVATANSGNSGILSGLNHHKLVPISSSDEMAKAIQSLLNMGPDTRKAIFEESRKFIQDHYSVSKMVDGYVETFLRA